MGHKGRIGKQLGSTMLCLLSLLPGSTRTILCRHSVVEPSLQKVQPVAKLSDSDEDDNEPSSTKHAASEGCEDDETNPAEAEKITGSRKQRARTTKTSTKSKASKARQNFVKMDRKVRQNDAARSQKTTFGAVYICSILLHLTVPLTS